MEKKLPDAELTAMMVIWDSESAIATKDILQRVNAQYDKQWNVSTLQPLLNRLTARGFIRSERVGRDKYYTAIVPQDEYLEKETAEFLSKHYKGSVFDMVSALYKASDLSQDEINKLRELLNRGSDYD